MNTAEQLLPEAIRQLRTLEDESGQAGYTIWSGRIGVVINILDRLRASSLEKAAPDRSQPAAVPAGYAVGGGEPAVPAETEAMSAGDELDHGWSAYTLAEFAARDAGISLDKSSHVGECAKKIEQEYGLVVAPAKAAADVAQGAAQPLVATDAKVSELIEIAAKLRNALYTVIPPPYPSSINHPDSAGPRWDRKYVADNEHFRVRKDAVYAADELLHSLRGTEIETRGVELARALSAQPSPPQHEVLDEHAVRNISQQAGKGAV